MRPEDLERWLVAQPFVPFRIVMNSGTSMEVRHPEVVHILRTSFLHFVPSADSRFDDYFQMFGLVLIERIEPLAPVPVSGGGNGEASP